MESIYVTTRKEWRDWLSENFKSKKEIWLVLPKKSSGKPRIEYNVAIEEALCFGWIDSIIKSHGDDSTMQRFSVRRTGSSYSQPNKERLKWLYRNGKIDPSITDTILPVLEEDFIFPEDIISIIKTEKEVWNNYKNFSDGYKRIRIAFIDSARKRPEEFQKRLNNFIDKTRKNKMIKGFGGIEKYY